MAVKDDISSLVDSAGRSTRVSIRDFFTSASFTSASDSSIASSSDLSTTFKSGSSTMSGSMRTKDSESGSTFAV